jgi:peptide/nickel transport system permease protein
MWLTGASLLLALLVTIPLGIYQAVRRHRPGDHVATGLELALYAMPQFLLCLLAIQFFAFTWHIFGYQASQSTSLLAVMAGWHSMTLPIACSAMVIIALLSRYMRSAAIDTLGQDYIKVARGQRPARAAGAVPAPAAQRVLAADHLGRTVNPGPAGRQLHRGDGLQLQRPGAAV